MTDRTIPNCDRCWVATSTRAATSWSPRSRSVLRRPCSPCRPRRSRPMPRGSSSARSRSRSRMARCPRIARGRKARGRFRSCSSCRRSSVCTSTSRTSAGGFAKEGYLAIAVELYARQGDVSKMTDFKEILAKVVVQGSGRAGHVGSGCRGCLGAEVRRGRPGAAGCDRVLLGRPYRLALRRAQHDAQGRRRLVRTARRARRTSCSRATRLTLPASCGRPCSGCTAGATRASRSRTSRRCVRRSPRPTTRRRSSCFPTAEHGFNADYRPSYNARGGEGCVGTMSRVVPRARRRLIRISRARRSTARSAASCCASRSRR